MNQGSPEVKDTEEARNYKAETQPQQKKRFKEDSILVEDMDESWLAEPVVKMQPPPKQAPQPSFKKPVQERSQYDGDSIFVEELEDSWIATPMTKKPAHSSKQAPQPSFSKPTQHRKQPVGESWLVEDIDDVWLAEYPRQKRPQGQQVNGAKQNVHKQPIKQAEPKRVNQKQKASFDKLFADEEVSGVLADGKDHKKVGADWNFKPKVYKSKKIESKRNVLSEVVDSAFDALRATGVRVPILDSIKPKVYRPSNVKEKQREAAATKENAYKALKSLINSIF